MKNFTSSTGEWNLKIPYVDSIMSFEIIGDNIYTMETKTDVSLNEFNFGAVTKGKAFVFKQKITFDVSETLRFTGENLETARLKITEFKDKVIFSM